MQSVSGCVVINCCSSARYIHVSFRGGYFTSLLQNNWQ